MICAYIHIYIKGNLLVGVRVHESYNTVVSNKCHPQSVTMICKVRNTPDRPAVVRVVSAKTPC